MNNKREKIIHELLDRLDCKLYFDYIGNRVPENYIPMLKEYEAKLKELSDDDLEYEFNEHEIMSLFF